MPGVLSFGQFYGARGLSAAAGAFNAAILSADPNRIVEPHSHDDAHFIYVLGGRYASKAEPERALTAGDLIYNPPGTEHCDTFTSGQGAFLALSVRVDWAQAALGTGAS